MLRIDRGSFWNNINKHKTVKSTILIVFMLLFIIILSQLNTSFLAFYYSPKARGRQIFVCCIQ